MNLKTRLVFGGLGFVLVLISLLGVVAEPVTATAALPQTAEPIYLYYFWGEGCPYCEQAEIFLDELQARYPELRVIDFEVWNNRSNQELFSDMANAYGFDAQYVPAIFLGNQYWVGYNDSIRDELDLAMSTCAADGCIDAGADIVPGHTLSAAAAFNEDTIRDPASTSKSLYIPLLGKVNLDSTSLWVSTALISFVDGFNPCSLWVLSILIAMTVRTGSRKKVFIIGITFITVTALVYVLFIAGLFTVLSFTQYLGWIQVGVSILALFFAMINIKDYFWYKEGVSLTIDDEAKPGLYKRMRKVMQAGDSLGALLAATVGLALGVSLIEFSCTAGFPVLWTNIVAAQDVSPLTFVLLLLLYMVIYQIDEFVIFTIAVTTLRVSKLEEKHGRILKLVGGVLMLTLAAVMLINPNWMDSVENSVAIFIVAFAATAAILWLHRKVLPRFGIYIGTEKLLRNVNKKRYKTKRS